MATPNYTISLVASPIGGTAGITPGDVLVYSTSSSSYVLSTTANRSSRRSSGVAVGSASVNGAVLMQSHGHLPAAISGLGAGSPTWVRVSATGRLERAPAPTIGDDIIGRCEADGTVHLCAGFLTSAIVTGGGGSTPTGTGLRKVVADVEDAAASLVLNADVDPAAAIAGSKLQAASGSNAGSMSAADKTKLDGMQVQGSAAAIAALAIDWNAGTVFTKTIASNTTFTFSNASSGMVIIVRITAGAGNTVTWPTVRWAGGTAPTQTPSGTDVYTFVHDGANIYGSVVQAMA